jgi:hypothetical protein
MGLLCFTVYKEKATKLLRVTNLTEISTWTKSFIKEKMKIILVKNTKITLCLMVSWFAVVYVSVVYVCSINTCYQETVWKTPAWNTKNR